MSGDPQRLTPPSQVDLLGDPRAALASLSPAQRAAVTHAHPRLLVMGAAGTGKTRALEERFRWLVARGCEPARICVLLPTGARAAALRARIEAWLPGGYEELSVVSPLALAGSVLRRAGAGGDPAAEVLGAGERLAMLLERIDDLSLSNHDLGGRPTALLSDFVRRIARLKAQLVTAERYAAWANSLPDDPATDAARQREFAGVYEMHDRLLRDAGARDEGDLIADALALARRGDERIAPCEHLLVDDATELDLAPAALALALRVRGSVTLAWDPHGPQRGDEGVAARRARALAPPGAPTVVLERGERCRAAVWHAARAALAELDGPEHDRVLPPAGGEVAWWRCAGERAQAQAVAADVEWLLARGADDERRPRIAVLVPSIAHEGQAIALALEERAISHRLVGEAAFFQRAEIRDLLAWLRLLTDPTDAGAVVRALARPPIELRSVDIARCTQIARRRKLDMVSALAAAIEAPQVPPEARERIRGFLKLYQAGLATIDTIRPDLYVHRLIERLGLRRQQLFTAQADVVERLRALARFGDLASAHVTRAPQATPREFAKSVSAVAEFGVREPEEPDVGDPDAVQVLALGAAGDLEADHVYVVGLHAGRLAAPAPEPIADELLEGAGSPDVDVAPAAAPGWRPEADPALAGAAAGRSEADQALARQLYAAFSRCTERLVVAFPRADDRGGSLAVAPAVEAIRVRLGAAWEDRDEELFGPAEALHSTYRLLRDELLEGTMRAGGRLGELRFDTDLDVSHAVVRYLELLKLAALIARPEGQSVAESLRDVNARILQAVTSEQREIFESSALDEYLLDSERDARRRAQAVAARDEPSLEQFLPRRGDGVVLSATDIDTYRTCPLKYKFARVLRIPQEPTLHQRFGILVHQVLERFHVAGLDSGGGVSGSAHGSLPVLLGLLQDGWRRGGFGDSEEERQLRGKATAALTRYHERCGSEEGRPVWFERQFTFRLGPHLLRGRVDRVDRLPDGDYELIDYKTGRPKSPAQLAEDVQLSLYAVGAREAWQLDASRQAYYYLLDDRKVAVPGDDAGRAAWVREVAMEVAEGILSQGFEPTPSFSACSMCDYRLACPAAER